MAKKLLIFGFYLTCGVIYNFGLYYNLFFCIFPHHNGIYDSTIDKLQYLTNWLLVVLFIKCLSICSYFSI